MHVMNKQYRYVYKRIYIRRIENKNAHIGSHAHNSTYTIISHSLNN